MTKVFKYQFWHLLSLVLLLYLIGVSIQIFPGLTEGTLIGVNSVVWLRFAVAIPVIHQIYVMICWRLELYGKRLSKQFGNSAFPLFKAGFVILILLRPVSIILLAISNMESFTIGVFSKYFLLAFLLAPSIYLFYSVKKYFGFDRAFGVDHFKPERIVDEPIIRRGIFKYTSNGMYVFGFLILWVPGVLLQSSGAILAALFNHLYIWVHYYFTEKPDMKEIYN